MPADLQSYRSQKGDDDATNLTKSCDARGLQGRPKATRGVLRVFSIRISESAFPRVAPASTTALLRRGRRPIEDLLNEVGEGGDGEGLSLTGMFNSAPIPLRPLSHPSLAPKFDRSVC